MFWRICCAGIDIPQCLRVKIRWIKITLAAWFAYAGRLYKHHLVVSSPQTGQMRQNEGVKKL